MPDATPTQSTVERHAGRLLLIDPDDRVLLLGCRESEDSEVWWITPGGGLEDGETYAQAAARETLEETGIDVGSPESFGSAVWERRHEFPWLGQLLCQYERFFLARVDTQDVTPHHHTPDEVLYLCGHRWWAVDEIKAAVEDGVKFAPRGLAEHLEALLRQRPGEMVDVGM